MAVADIGPTIRSSTALLLPVNWLPLLHMQTGHWSFLAHPFGLISRPAFAMWLLNIHTRLLERFEREETQKSMQIEDDRLRASTYAILSHTWEKEEVTFQDIKSPAGGHNLAGYQKIEYTCQQAIRDGLEYVWIDTCCIDKASSSELSEAINSMYQWYEDANICYAYLPDVEAPEEGEDIGEVLGQSRSYSIAGIGILSGTRWSLSMSSLELLE